MGEQEFSYTLDGNLLGAITEKINAERFANWMHSAPAWSFIELYSDKEMIYSFEDKGQKVSVETILNAPWNKANRIRVGGAGFVTKAEPYNERTAHEIWIILQFLGVVKDVG